MKLAKIGFKHSLSCSSSLHFTYFVAGIIMIEKLFVWTFMILTGSLRRKKDKCDFSQYNNFNLLHKIHNVERLYQEFCISWLVVSELRVLCFSNTIPRY